MIKQKNIPRIPVETVTCFGKVPLHTITAAMDAQERATKKWPGWIFNIYICHNCGEYHIGRLKKAV